jgi:hypothetical protein
METQNNSPNAITATELVIKDLWDMYHDTVFSKKENPQILLLEVTGDGISYKFLTVNNEQFSQLLDRLVPATDERMSRERGQELEQIKENWRNGIFTLFVYSDRAPAAVDSSTVSPAEHFLVFQFDGKKQEIIGADRMPLLKI